MHRTACLCLLWALGACEGKPKMDPRTSAPKPGTHEAAAKTATDHARPAAQDDTASGGPKVAAPAVVPNAELPAGPTHGAPANEIPWTGSIAWVDYEHGLAQAKAEKRGVCIVLYADWCPRCKELAPVFERPEVALAARDLVMIRQDDDEKPRWVRERFDPLGNYVPRVFFLSPDGTLRKDLTSGHPRYPYFYSPHVADRLAANMRTAATTGG